MDARHFLQERKARYADWEAKASLRAGNTPKKRTCHPGKVGNVEYVDEEDDPAAGIVINRVRQDGEQQIRIDPHISQNLKMHQVILLVSEALVQS